MKGLHPLVAELRRLRMELGLTQAAVAQSAGISNATISEIERGLHEPRLSTFLAYAQVVGLPMPTTPETPE